MRRRQTGLLLIGAVVLLMFAVANLRPQLITGTPVAAPVPGLPAVGDCVTDPLPSSIAAAAVAATLAESRTALATHPHQELHPCGKVRYGEVVSVLVDPVGPPVTADGRPLSVSDPNLRPCQAAVARFTGTDPTLMTDHWFPVLQTIPTLVAPSDRQQAAGQRWLACVASPPPASGESSPAMYSETLRDALHTGRLRNQLGYCDGGLSAGPEPVAAAPQGCDRRHTAEVLATSTTTQAISRAALQRSCDRAVLLLTRMPDPTAGGALTVQLRALDDNGALVRGAQIPALTELQCGIAANGGRALDGSLLALGSDPVPWG